MNSQKGDGYMSCIVIVALWATLLGGAVVGVHQVRATQVEKITWCHTEPSGNSQTLELPPQALQNAGHMDANGNPLHAGDHAGVCEVVPTGSTGVSGPTGFSGSTGASGEEGCEECEPTSTPSATPEPTSGFGLPGDGLNDGRSDGRSSCPECTKVPVLLEGTTTLGFTGGKER